MLYDFIFLLILFALIYSYMSTQSQFAATASAIRQIWSGSCRLSCRHSEHSSLSGLSGLPGPPHVLGHSQSKPGPILGQGQVAARGSTAAGPSRDCNCESCPCALIENFLRTCRPATNIYAELIQCTSNCVTYFLQMVEDAYEYVMRVFECNATCQRQAQLISTREYCGSDENFSFGRGDKQNPIDKVKSAIKEKSQTLDNLQQNSKKIDGDAAPANENRKTSSANKEQISNDLQLHSKKQDDDAGPTRNSPRESMQQGTSKDVSVLKESANGVSNNLKVPVDATKIPNSSDESMSDKGFCSKCIEKGRTCLKQCPRAGKKANK